MSNETINLTIVDQDEPISVVITEQQPIQVNFYEIAQPDPRVAQALIDAEAAKVAAEEAKDAALAAQEETEEIVAGLGETIVEEVDEAFQAALPELQENSIINALIFG